MPNVLWSLLITLHFMHANRVLLFAAMLFYTLLIVVLSMQRLRGVMIRGVMVHGERGGRRSERGDVLKRHPPETPQHSLDFLPLRPWPARPRAPTVHTH